MNWKKLGRVFNPSQYKSHEKLKSHASNPTIVKLNNDLVRVFYSGRDIENRSSVGAFDFNMKTLKVQNNYYKPFFSPKNEKSFFRDGVSVGTALNFKGNKYLYFMGWQNPKTEHWRGDIGRLKILEKGIIILDPDHAIVSKNEVDRVSVSYPWIIKSKEGLLKMWYGSTISWNAGNDEMLHVINYATSKDGLNWNYKGQVIRSKIGFAQAFSRPTIYESNNLDLHMWFSYRSGSGKSYRIGYAFQKYGNSQWELLIDKSGIETSSSGWDSKMIAYPCIYKYNKELYMFYNGNQFGKTGIGIAVTNDID